MSLTSPGANQSFTAPATVTLTADANDPDGVARVAFFHGATLIGSAVSSPYRVAWNHVPAGRYLLTAQATDRLGASQTSAAVPITVNAPASAGLTILYLHADHLGTPRVATDESQTVVWRNPPTIEPFGMVLPDEDPDGHGRVTTIHLRFPGQYFDQETQAHYTCSMGGRQSARGLYSVRFASRATYASAHDQRSRTDQPRDQMPDPRGIHLSEHGILPAPCLRASGRMRRGMDDRENLSQPATVITSPEINRLAPIYRKEVTLPDSDGVARVDFFHGATLISSAVSSPYRVV